MVKIYALINIYCAKETIIDCLESLLERVDEVILLDGRWIGVDGDSLHSPDGTIDLVTDFAKKHLELPITYLLAEKLMHQVESRQFLLNQVPDGEWFLFIDSDEYIMTWMDNIKEFLEKTDKKYFNVCGKFLPVRLGWVRLGKKTKDLYCERNHRWMSDKNGKILIGDLQKLPIQIPQNSKRATKTMREPMKKYAEWLFSWEHPNEQKKN